MSFHVPSEELDFTIYGDANTNQLQLPPSQHRLLQKQYQIAAQEEQEGGPSLTGYQSGLFAPALGRKPHRESKKRQTSVVFADLPHPSSPTEPESSSLPQQQQQRPRKSNRHGSMKIDTSLGTIYAPTSGSNQANESVQQPHRQEQQQQESYKQHRRSYRLSKQQRQSQSSPNFFANPVTDHVAKEEDEKDYDRENHTPAAVMAVVRGGDNSRSQIVPSSSTSSSSQRHLLRHPHKNHAITTANGRRNMNHDDEDEDENREGVVQGLEVVQYRQEGGPLLIEPEGSSPSAAALRLPTARSATIISTTSSSGLPRLTHRLSYLAHLQDLEAYEEDDVVPTLFPQPDHPSHAFVAAASPAAAAAPLSAPVLPSPPMASEAFSSRRPSLPVKQSVSAALAHSSKATQSRSGSSPTTYAHKPPVPQQTAAVPPIPKLYKRLLRVFKPPTDSSDSDHGSNPSAQSPPVPPHSRGPFGLPAYPEGSRSGTKSAPTSKRPSLSHSPPVAPVLPSLASVAKVAVAPPHKASESTDGFRARFLRRLISSPNLNTTVYPASPTSAPSSRADLTKLDVSLASQHASGWQGDVGDQPSLSPHSPLPSDFEHDQSCPAGQRIAQRRNAGGRPRAATTSRIPPPMPTLQSKYGVPGRELGAGTQAQVMLLRVKSSKRLRSSKNKDVASWPRSAATQSPFPSSSSQQQHHQQSNQYQRDTLSPVDQDLGSGAGDSLLAPYARTGTLMTTTEDEVTPEQREAYRKRLLRRTSTGGLSVTNGSGLIYAIKKFRPPRATETHRQFLKKVCAEFCISTSMDHENIIRTLDLVRDQPGQELVDEEVQDSRHYQDGGGGHQRSHQHPHDGHDDYVQTEHQRREEARDCNCSRSHHRRVRTLKSVGGLHANGGSNQGHAGSSGSGSSTPSGLSSQSSKHRTIARKSVISKPQRMRSMDTTSIRRSIVGHPDRSPVPQPTQESSSNSHRHRDLYHWRSDAHQASSHGAAAAEAQALAALKKKKQQQHEQDIRQKEVLRLKQQREREKQQAKQLRLDQFPEYCMVMEFAAGGDLFNLLTKFHPPISLHEKHCLWRQLVNGVQYMHSMGVAHRDLKPENILIDGTGRILKITDFGVANVFKSVGDPSPLPCRGIIGSEPYIAPEEFYQEEYDPRAVDVWACGIIFYVMLYAAMPWARADRKKDARFSRYISDIMNHRHSEAQRRLQYERRQLHHYSLASNSTGTGSSGSGYGGHGSNVRTGSGSTVGSSSHSESGSVDVYSHPHEASHLRQFPPYNVNHHHQQQQQQESSSVESSRSGSPTGPQSRAIGDGAPESPQSSVNNSPVSGTRPSTVESSAKITGSLFSDPFASLLTSASPTVVVPPAAYNTFSYNGHLGGHEFIDRTETPGCRRVLYAVLEPDARKRLTIDQVLADEWVSRIRHCTDNILSQEEQAMMVYGRDAVMGGSVEVGRYLCLPNGQLHHTHAVPKKVKAT
ncbi:serine/threonine-protein kinase HAL4/sat4 [Mortierella sp. AD031]|nr:serine/threonine-protein kinase HAL4/sat4 [Mortierella sp. AD031]